MSEQKSKKHLSIKLHIFISMVALCLGLVLILWLGGAAFLRQIYGAIKMRDIEHASGQVSYIIEDEKLSTLLEKIADEYDLCAKIFAFEGDNVSLVGEADFFNDCIICDDVDLSNKELLGQMYESARENDGFHSMPVGDNNIITIQIAHSATKDCAYLVVLNTSSTPLSATIRTIHSLLGLMTVIAIAISLIASYFLSKRISSPIEKMDKEAKLMAKNEY